MHGTNQFKTLFLMNAGPGVMTRIIWQGRTFARKVLTVCKLSTLRGGTWRYIIGGERMAYSLRVVQI